MHGLRACVDFMCGYDGTPYCKIIFFEGIGVYEENIALLGSATEKALLARGSMSASVA